MNNIINGKVLKKVSFFIHASKPVKGFGVAYGVCNQNGEVIIGTIGSDNILNKKVWKASPGDCLNLFRTEKGESLLKLCRYTDIAVVEVCGLLFSLYRENEKKAFGFIDIGAFHSPKKTVQILNEKNPKIIFKFVQSKAYHGK